MKVVLLQVCVVCVVSLSGYQASAGGCDALEDDVCGLCGDISDACQYVKNVTVDGQCRKIQEIMDEIVEETERANLSDTEARKVLQKELCDSFDRVRKKL